MNGSTPSILLITGSTRARSTNTAVLTAAARIDATIATTILYTDLAMLPHFNQDIEESSVPEIVQALRHQIETADAVMFSTPEYAGAMPGALKNLIEWTIGGASFYGKPVGWINCSPRPGGAHLTYTSLRVVLAYAGADIVDAATARIPVASSELDHDGTVNDPETVDAICDVIARLAAYVVSGGPLDQSSESSQT